MKKKPSNSGEKKMGWLTGWKEIGSYIGCSSKTAISYFKKHRLPIYRLPETNKPTASPREIDEWVMKTKKRV